MGGITIQFQEIQLTDKPVFDKFFQQRRYENAHYNFTNLFMWRKAYQIQWATDGEILYVKAQWDGSEYALQPFGPDNAIHVALERWLAYFTARQQPFIMRGVEVFMVELLENIRPGLFSFTADRDNYDYVYNVQELTELKGRKYHAKKNHINSFLKTNPNHQYLPLTKDLTGMCREMLVEWCRKRGCESGFLEYEKNALFEVFSHFDELGCKGGVIMVDDKVEAFTLGERINQDTAVIHAEKGNADIRGIYPLISQQFCQHSWNDLLYVNREEDMGIPGLRKAKESYYPVTMIEKYVVTLR